jgi:hypothetical protein
MDEQDISRRDPGTGCRRNFYGESEYCGQRIGACNPASVIMLDIFPRLLKGKA